MKEDATRDFQVNAPEPELPAPPRRRQRWTVLMVGDKGAVVRIPRFNVLAGVVGAALIVFLASAVMLGGAVVGLRSEKSDLRARVTDLEETLKGVQTENDILTARLMVLEPPGPGAQEDAGGPAAPVDPPDRQTDPGSAADSEPVGEDGTAPETGAQETVAAEKITVKSRPADGRVDVRYVLRNVAEGKGAVAGYAFVVLKGDDASGRPDVVSPSAAMTDGRPSPPRDGQYFSITRFKYMDFSVTDVAGIAAYEDATIFVFDADGTLLLEKDFDL